MTLIVPTEEPAVIIAGDTLQWYRTDLPDYPADDGWVLTYNLRGASVIDIVAITYQDKSFEVNVVAATTAAYTIGDYWWSAYCTHAGDSKRYQVDYGTLEIKADIAQVSTDPYDGRSDVKKTLDAVEAVLLGRASKDQMAYTIAGRSLSKTPIPDLLAFRDKFKIEFAIEEDKEKVRNGKSTGRRILMRTKRN